MRRLGLSLLFATAALAVSTGVMARPASAEEADVDVTSDVFGEPLDEFLASYPNAQPQADGSFLLEPGVVLAPPATPSDDVGILESPSGCSDNWFCLFQHRDFGGWSLSYYYCTTVNLAAEHRNRISSMHNAQNSYSAYFWDIDPSPDVQGALGPNRYLRNLASDTAPDGRSWNDRIDRVKAC